MMLRLLASKRENILYLIEHAHRDSYDYNKIRISYNVCMRISQIYSQSLEDIFVVNLSITLLYHYQR